MVRKTDNAKPLHFSGLSGCISISSMQAACVQSFEHGKISWGCGMLQQGCAGDPSNASVALFSVLQWQAVKATMAMKDDWSKRTVKG